MNDDLHISEDGLNLLKKFEGFVGHIYLDVAHIPTIAWGHVLTPQEKASGVFANGISQEDATVLLQHDLVRFELAVKKYITVSLQQDCFDALICLIYNTGAGAIISGSLGKAINSGANIDAITTAWLLWCKVRDPNTNQLVVNQGLLGRRKSELALYKKGLSTNQPAPQSDPIPDPQPAPPLAPVADPTPVSPPSNDAGQITIPETTIAASPNKNPFSAILAALSQLFGGLFGKK